MSEKESISDLAKVYSQVKLDSSVSIGPFSVIGRPSSLSDNNHTHIKHSAQINCHVTIYSGATIGRDTYIDDYSRIGADANLSENVTIVRGARVGGDCCISKNVVIGGGIGERVTVGENSQLLGIVAHRHTDPTKGWNEDIDRDPAPIISHDVFAGIGSKIIGDIEVGNNTYITANAIVTENVPPFSIVHGVNNIKPYSEWDGELSDSPLFHE